MATLEPEKIRPQKAEPKRVAEFNSKTRSHEFSGIEKGDQFTIPQDFEIWEEDLNGTKLQYINVTTTTGASKHFYPVVFIKSRTVYTEDLLSTGKRVYTDGTAAEFVRTFNTLQEGMEALRGKTLKVTEMRTVRTLRYNTTSLMNAQIPTIDIVQ